MSRVLVWSCTHAPFHHKRAVKFLSQVWNAYRLDTAVCLGDVGDQHGWGRHGRLPDAVGQLCEHKRCLNFCKRLYERFPEVKACFGNHDLRVAKAAQRAGIPSSLHADVAEVYQSPDGWEWDTEFEIDGVLHTHGDQVRGGVQPAMEIAKARGMSAVIGHFHAIAGFRWFYSGGSRFGMNVGCLVDPDSYGMAYAKNFLYKPVLGCGVVIDGVPSFVPLT